MPFNIKVKFPKREIIKTKVKFTDRIKHDITVKYQNILTKVSQLINDADYQNGRQVMEKIKIMTNTYIHEQSLSSAEWHIVHNLDKFPSVTVVDSAGTVIDCDVQFINRNNCILRFNSAFTGKAYLN